MATRMTVVGPARERLGAYGSRQGGLGHENPFRLGARITSARARQNERTRAGSAGGARGRAPARRNERPASAVMVQDDPPRQQQEQRDTVDDAEDVDPTRSLSRSSCSRPRGAASSAGRSENPTAGDGLRAPVFGEQAIRGALPGAGARREADGEEHESDGPVPQGTSLTDQKRGDPMRAAPRRSNGDDLARWSSSPVPSWRPSSSQPSSWRRPSSRAPSWPRPSWPVRPSSRAPS